MVFTSRSTQNDHIYYNAIIRNNTNNIKVAKFSETRQTALIDDPSSYYATIARFQVPTTQLPIFNFINGSYSVTLTFNGVPFTTDLVFVRRDFAYPDEQFIFDYQEMIDMINTAFATSFTALKLAFPLAPPTVPPFMLYNGHEVGTSIRFEDQYDPAVASPTIEVYMNSVLFSFFNNYLIDYLSFTADEAVRFIVKDNGNNVVGTDRIMSQTYPTFYNWYDFKSLIITSNSLPIASEAIGAVVGGQSGLNTQLSIITDFVPTQWGTNDTASKLVYSPEPQYRYLDMYSNQSIRKLDFQILYEDKFGQIRPLFLAPGQEASIKMLFVKKDVVLGN